MEFDFGNDNIGYYNSQYRYWLPEITWSEKAIIPDITIYKKGSDEEKLVKDQDYKVDITDNVNAGNTACSNT